MAKRSIVHKPKKLEPSELTLNFRLPNNTGSPNSRQNIDLSQVTSILNRRFYRQGLAWAVAGFTLHTSGVASQIGQLQIRKLPTTWTMSNAWEKGFRAWQRMNNESLAETESVRPRFLDFKIYADKAHHANGFGENMLPFVRDDTGLVVYAAPGEWEASKMVIPKTDGTDDVFSREIIAVGANYPGAGASTLNAVSLTEGYSVSRALPSITDPNVPDDAADVNSNAPENWLQATFNQGTDQDDAVLTDMITENNIAPYPFENDGTNVDTMYPGGATQLPSLVLHDQVSVTTIGAPGSPAMSKRTATGGVFPCGLVQLNYSAALADAILQVHLVPGTHRGYMAKPMTDL